MTEPLRTVGLRALLFTHEAQPPDTVYAMTKTLAESGDQRRPMHAAVQPLRPKISPASPRRPFIRPPFATSAKA